MAQFINDTSIQTTTVFIPGSLFTSTANPNLRLSSSAGVYYPSTDNFRIFVNSTDALTIDSNGILYGNATGLTNLTYNNINGKPTNFQCDYNSTLINKPTNFQCDYNSTLVNKPTNFQCDYNSTLINKPTSYPADMTNIYTKTSTDTLFSTQNTINSNYFINSNSLNNIINTYGFDTIALRNSSIASQNTINSNYFINSNSLNNILNTYSFDTIALRNSSIASQNTINSNYFINSNSLNNIINTYSFDTIALRNSSIASQNTINSNYFINSNSLNNIINTYSFDTIALRNSSIASQNTINSNYFVSSNVSTNIFNNLITPYDTIVARNTALGSYLTTATASSTYATITNLNSKENTLTFNSPLIRSVNSISFSESSITALTNFYNKTDTLALSTLTNYYNKTDSEARYLKLTGGTMTGQITGVTTLNASTGLFGTIATTNNTNVNVPSVGIQGGISDRIILANGTVSTYPYSFGINTNTLWYSAPSGASHKFYVNGSLISTIDSTGISTTGIINASTNLQENGTNLSSKYLQLTGGNITGNLSVGTTNVLSRLTVRGRYDDGNSGGLCINSYDGNVYNLRLYAFTPAGSKVNYNFQVNNIASSVIALTIANNGYIGVNYTTPRCHLEINGIVNINNGNPYAIPNNYMASGSLTIGGIDVNYGGGNNWSTNTAGLLMECLDNTEIAIHDANNRLASLMYYEGGTNNRITIGRDMGFGAISSVNINSTIIELKNLSYINFPNTIYLQSTNTSKIITVANGSLTLEGILVVQGAGINVAANAVITWANEWTIFKGTINGVTNSLIFNHIASGINSYWYFNGTQTSTNSEISDERVKKEIEPITDGLDKFMLLKPKQYMLCEDKDYNKKFGIIAQDVEVDFPELIHTDTEYIANIYDYATYNNFIITLNKDITDLINVNDELKILLDNNDKNNLEIAIDDTPYNNRYKKRFVKVVEIVDNHSFKIDIELKENNVFVFGKKVNDFKKLDYQSLYCLNIAATQELYKIIKKLEERISILESSSK